MARVALPTLEESGLSAPLSLHFGRAPCYTVVETGTGDAEIFPNLSLTREYGPCSPLVSLAEAGVDAVVCRQLGRNAFRSWNKAGVAVYLTRAGTVAEALVRFNAGELTPL